MIVSQDNAKRRLERVIVASRSIQRDQSPSATAKRAHMAEMSGLSIENVNHAIETLLETQPSEQEQHTFVEKATANERCHVLLSANVCTAAHRAISYAVACAPHVFVRPSRRDPVLAEWLVSKLQSDPQFMALASIELTDHLAPAPGDTLHIYGSDETIAEVTANLPSAVDVRAHGTGFGVGLLAASKPQEATIDQLANDLIAFDGRGCLSPRLVLVSNATNEQLHSMARRLHDRLETAGKQRPRGPLSDADLGSLRRFRTIFESLGGWFEGPHHAIGIDVDPSHATLIPAMRTVAFARVTPHSGAQLLRGLEPFVTCLGGDHDHEDFSLLSEAIPRARRCNLGDMQRPPFDGPVDLRAFNDAQAGR